MTAYMYWETVRHGHPLLAWIPHTGAGDVLAAKLGFLLALAKRSPVGTLAAAADWAALLVLNPLVIMPARRWLTRPGAAERRAERLAPIKNMTRLGWHRSLQYTNRTMGRFFRGNVRSTAMIGALLGGSQMLAFLTPMAALHLPLWFIASTGPMYGLGRAFMPFISIWTAYRKEHGISPTRPIATLQRGVRGIVSGVRVGCRYAGVSFLYRTVRSRFSKGTSEPEPEPPEYAAPRLEKVRSFRDFWRVHRQTAAQRAESLRAAVLQGVIIPRNLATRAAIAQLDRAIAETTLLQGNQERAVIEVGETPAPDRLAEALIHLDEVLVGGLPPIALERADATLHPHVSTFVDRSRHWADHYRREEARILRTEPPPAHNRLLLEGFNRLTLATSACVVLVAGVPVAAQSPSQRSERPLRPVSMGPIAPPSTGPAEHGNTEDVRKPPRTPLVQLRNDAHNETREAAGVDASFRLTKRTSVVQVSHYQLELLEAARAQVNLAAAERADGNRGRAETAEAAARSALWTLRWSAGENSRGVRVTDVAHLQRTFAGFDHGSVDSSVLDARLDRMITEVRGAEGSSSGLDLGRGL